MLQAAQFVDAARARGYAWYAGVPCSFLTPFINFVIDDPDLTYVSAANEGDAVAAAAGAYIGGKLSVAMMQNSGLGNAVSPLTSLTHVFQIPLLIICTHRGAPGVHDEPQHALMGVITEQMFDTMQIPWEIFPKEVEQLEPTLARAVAHCTTTQRPYALIMHKGTVAPHHLLNREMPHVMRADRVHGAPLEVLTGKRPTREQALTNLLAHAPLEDTVVIATTGFTGRELYALADRPNHLYMVGSMGCASSLGLGLAMARPDLKVLVLDGDGAALMRMGNLSTVGTYGPRNLYHIVLDNEAHDSTGAQATVTVNVDFAEIARACGYALCIRGDQVSDLNDFMQAPEAAGARFLHLKIATGTRDDLPRPTVTPPEVLQRLRRHLANP